MATPPLVFWFVFAIPHFGDLLPAVAKPTLAGWQDLVAEPAVLTLVWAQQWGSWPQVYAQGGALIDPMCGSGTLVIEAAMMAADVAPGLLRHGGSLPTRPARRSPA